MVQLHLVVVADALRPVTYGVKTWIGMTTEELLWDWPKNTRYGRERLGGATLVGELKGWRLPTGKRQPIHANGVIAVGDAGNMIEQFGGGGVPQAISAGAIAAKVAHLAVKTDDFSKDFLKRYSDMIDQALGPSYQHLSAATINICS